LKWDDVGDATQVLRLLISLRAKRRMASEQSPHLRGEQINPRHVAVNQMMKAYWQIPSKKE
jgi:hypothetical protein